MTTQTTLFPKTELDEATAVLAHLISEEEKADKAADAAGQKAADTASRVRKQRHVVAKLQAMMPAAEPIVDGETAPEDIEDAEILQIEGDVLDPITGEVTSKDRFSDPPAGKIGTRCPDCDGDGRVPDKTGGGHHGSCPTCQGSGSIQPTPAVSCDTCGRDCNSRQREGSGHTGCGDGSWEPRKPEVLVAWPDNLDMQRIEVGPLTRYGELAAKFLNSLPGDDPRRVDSFLDYRIVGVADLGDGDRDPHATIVAADYGLKFSVEAIAKAEESAA